VIDVFASLSAEPEGDGGQGGGLINWAIGGLTRFGGFLIQAAFSIGTWLLTHAWESLVELTFTIVTFDWNQTDASIKAEISQNNTAIFGALGNLAGTGLVWLTSLGVASLAAIKFPVIAGKIALALAEEGGEEIRGQLAQLFSTARRSLLSNWVLTEVLTQRRLRLFGQAPITSEREPWTIAGQVEKSVESIGNPQLKAFVSNFIESATEAIIEVGYVVSYALDDYYSSTKLANEGAFGEKRAVKITPDARVEGETIVLTGSQKLIQQDIQTTLATHKLVYNRDVGQIVGQPAEDWLKAGTQRRKLTIVFKSKPEPPWIIPSGRVREVTATIPDAKVGLSWATIKAAANPWTWGKYRATANLDNGRQMAVYGASEGQAETKLRELLALSTANILTLSVTEEKDRHQNLKKDPVQMYPAYATLLIRRSTAELTGTNDLSGQNFKQEHIRLELWTETEPEGISPLQ
jgi:hypothetical protein